MYAGEWLESLISPEIQAFIRANESEDPFNLSLKFNEVSGVPISIISAQIRSRQKAKHKLHEWFANDCIIFPPAENLEQASSELTARFKATLLTGKRFIDLTGGTGIDTYYISEGFQESIYVEEQSDLCRIASHNFSCLQRNIEIIENNARDFLESFSSSEPVKFFIDPSRRDNNQQRVVQLGDCSPDVREILNAIFACNGTCLLKLSPMLDVNEARKDLKNQVSHVYIVAANGEVKELLFMIQPQTVNDPLFTVADLYANRVPQLFSFHKSEEERMSVDLAEQGDYLYEPSAALRKSGAFKLLASRFRLRKIAMNTHLYVSDEYLPEFQGRIFRMNDLISYQPKKLRSVIKSRKANISTRNFPEDVAQIRKKSQLTDGGDLYLFCFTDQFNSLKVAVCEKP